MPFFAASEAPSRPESAEALKGETGSRTLEEAFIALTGRSIRADEAAPIDRMRMMRRVWRR